MPRARDWDSLGDRQRKRYESRAGKEGLTPGQARDFYNRGGDITRWRGKQIRLGITPSQWDRLMALGKQARWTVGRDEVPLAEVVEDMLRKGFDYKFIAERLREKAEARDFYSRLSKKQRRLRGNRGPGTDNFARRVTYANVELYYYH